MRPCLGAGVFHKRLEPQNQSAEQYRELPVGVCPFVGARIVVVEARKRLK